MSKRKQRSLFGFRFPISRRAGCGFVLLMALATIGMIGIMVWGFSNLLSPLGDRGNEFMTEIKTEQYDAAYAMMSNKFRQNETQQEFVGLFKEFSQATDWSFATFSVNGIIGRIRGRVVFDGQEYNLTIHFVYEENRWAVTGFDFGLYQETEFIIPTPTPVPTEP